MDFRTYTRILKLNDMKKRCKNCKHAGAKFKILDDKHLHCEHPDYKEYSGWATVMTPKSKCHKYEKK